MHAQIVFSLEILKKLEIEYDKKHLFEWYNYIISQLRCFRFALSVSGYKD
jgi:hypothetical protein